MKLKKLVFAVLVLFCTSCNNQGCSIPTNHYEDNLYTIWHNVYGEDILLVNEAFQDFSLIIFSGNNPKIIKSNHLVNVSLTGISEITIFDSTETVIYSNSEQTENFETKSAAFYYENGIFDVDCGSPNYPVVHEYPVLRSFFDGSGHIDMDFYLTNDQSEMIEGSYSSTSIAFTSTDTTFSFSAYQGFVF